MINRLYGSCCSAQLRLTALASGDIPMARRATWRIPIRLNVKLNAGGTVCSGTVTNLSEKGMFISIEDSCLAEGTNCEITIFLEDKMLHLQGKLVRLAEVKGRLEGIGVELTESPQGYQDFVENLLYVL